jgi:hypothetical protein
MSSLSAPLAIVAAGLSVFAAAIHAFVGHRRVMTQLQASALDPFARATLTAIWHMVTWTFLVLAGGFVAGGLVRGGDAIRIGAGLLAGGDAVILVVVAQRTFGAAIRLPQWIILGALGVYALIPRFATAALLGGLAVVHVAWALGARWPARDKHGLAMATIGRRASSGPVACLTVAVAVAGMTLALVVGPPPWLRATIAAIFIARGTIGFVERWLRREIRGTPYEAYSLLMYTPLALSIGLAVLAGA